ncbi:MAG: hypothetical protein ABII00_17940 [Elusimicrobiota bacterium]
MPLWQSAPLCAAAAAQEKSTQALAGKVERWVRAHPAQWLWVHRRFKNLT